MSRRIFISLIIVCVIFLVALLSWFLFFRGSTASLPIQLGSFGTALDRVVGLGGSLTGNTATQSGQQTSNGTTKIFAISTDPVISATFIQTSNPTTTVARFVTQQDGHVFDFPLGTTTTLLPVSVTTIPGSERVLWAQGGSAMILQYLDDTETIKTVYVKFAPVVGTSTSQNPAEVAFFPDNITDIAVSPDGTSVAYLLKNQTGGTNGYTALADGSKPKNLFSIPLTQLLLSWPAAQFLLLQTKSAVDVPGIVFEVGAKSGSMVPLVYGDGITAIANNDFSQILYQTRAGGVNNTYLHTLATGGDVRLGTISPERCVWDALTSNMLYCANPTTYVDASYLDSWHQGALNYQDNILSLQVSPSVSGAIASPGSDGIPPSDIAQLMISPDDQYLMYITKGDRSLWGVHLTQ